MPVMQMCSTTTYSIRLCHRAGPHRIRGSDSEAAVNLTVDAEETDGLEVWMLGEDIGESGGQNETAERRFRPPLSLKFGPLRSL